MHFKTDPATVRDRFFLLYRNAWDFDCADRLAGSVHLKAVWNMFFLFVPCRF